MDTEKFINLFNLLSYKYQQIVINTLIRMEHSDYSQKLSTKTKDIRGNIKKYQNSLNLTDQEVCDKVSELSSLQLTLDTYRCIRNQNVQDSSYLKWIAEIFEVTEEKLKEGKSREQYYNLAMISSDIANLKWLFNSLNDNNKNAIVYLVKTLKTLETAPEQFEYSNDD